MADSNITVNGLVIKETKYGEGNKILTVLTDTHGKIQAVANGVRSYKSKISAGCGLYCYSKFLLKQGRGMYNITAADTICNFYGLRNDYERLAYAAYFGDLVNAVTVEDEAENVLRLMLNTLYYIENTDNLAFSKPVFELRLMSECGFMPNVFSCTSCTETKELSYFSCQEGVSYCACCTNKRNATQAVIEAMRYIISTDLKKIFSFTVTNETLFKINEITEKYVLNQINNAPKSLIYLKTNI